MVALKKYARIEAPGLWRAAPDQQRRNVVVIIGDATLTIKAPNDQALAHWSLAAVKRLNPGKTPAQFHPDGDAGELLELPEEEIEMVDAIETLRLAVERARPRRGRLRWLGFALSFAAVLWLGLAWLPKALVEHTLTVVHEVSRKDIGQDLFSRIQRVTGPACGTARSNSSLARLAVRLEAGDLAVMRGGLGTALHLPGGQILLARQLVEDFEEPDVVAGFVLAEQVRAAGTDPLRALLEFGGTYPTFRLLTTGRMETTVLDAYAEQLLMRAADAPPERALLTRFSEAGVRSTPYAYARDVTGETVLGLIEADPMRARAVEPLLSDADWLRLQAVCGA